jgi:hypothetical protein
MREMPRNRSLADRSGIPSVVVHAARKVNATEVIGWLQRMDGVLAGFRLKHPHLSEIGQAVRLRFVKRAASSHFGSGQHSTFPADRANLRSDIS